MNFFYFPADWKRFYDDFFKNILEVLKKNNKIHKFLEVLNKKESVKVFEVFQRGFVNISVRCFIQTLFVNSFKMEP